MLPNLIPQTFENIDADKWQRIVATCQQEGGIQLTSNTGTASKDGVTISYAYYAETNTLVVSVVKREFFDPSELTLEQKIATWVAEA